EIRGAGNLLGMEQHGHIEAIGYDLYVKFLNDTIRRFKGDVVEDVVETNIDLNVNGYIPDKYISDEEIKVEIYKKIASIQNKEDYHDLVEELIDRFGDIPKEVDNLMKISYIKYISSRSYITSIVQGKNFIDIQFSSSSLITPELINELSTKYKRRLQFDLSGKPIFKFRPGIKILEDLKVLIEKISGFLNGKSSI
ncbi:transcription-repair coupling factor, partial [Anaerosalibacter bizertensis]|nr:transcription-repair coupling factor [Anaerosalibacter bizertensis]